MCVELNKFSFFYYFKKITKVTAIYFKFRISFKNINPVV